MKRHFGRAFVFAVLAVCLFVTSPVLAVTLPPAVAFTEAYPGGNGPFITNSGPPPQASVYTSVDPFGGQSVASAGFFGVGATAFGQAGGQAYETYYFEVNGPQNGVPVPLSLTSTMSAIFDRGIFNDCCDGGAYSQILYDSHYVSQRSVGQDSPSIFLPSISVTPDTTHEIDLYAIAGTNDIHEEDGLFAQANASLTIQIDPLFLAGNPGYSLEFSDGIDNVPIAETPVPPALPMFGAALVALGAFAWRRRTIA